MTASFLRASLFTSVVSFGVAVFAFGMGLLMILIGYILFRLSSLIVEAERGARRRRHLTAYGDRQRRTRRPLRRLAVASSTRWGVLVEGVERVAARHEPVAGRGGAVAERAADQRRSRAGGRRARRRAGAGS